MGKSYQTRKGPSKKYETKNTNYKKEGRNHNTYYYLNNLELENKEIEGLNYNQENSPKQKNWENEERELSQGRDFRNIRQPDMNSGKSADCEVDNRIIGGLESWLITSNRLKDKGEVNIFYSKKFKSFVVERFAMGHNLLVDSSSLGRNIVQAVQTEFGMVEPEMQIKNIEEVLREGETQLKLETMRICRDTTFLVTLCDMMGPTEEVLTSNANVCFQTAIEDLNHKLRKRENIEAEPII